MIFEGLLASPGTASDRSRVHAVDDPTCPTGGDPALSRLVLELSLGQVEGELEAGLEQHGWTNREASGEVGHTRTPAQRRGETHLSHEALEPWRRKKAALKCNSRRKKYFQLIMRMSLSKFHTGKLYDK